MVKWWRSLVLLFFLALLFIYARSEGEYFATLLFVVFASIFGVELLAFQLFRHAVDLKLTFPEKTAEAKSPFGMRLSLRFPRITTGTVRLKYSLPVEWIAEKGTEITFALPFGVTAATETLQVIPSRRGIYHIGPFFAYLEDPLRLYMGRVNVLAAQSVLVAPQLIPLHKLGWLKELESLDGRLAFEGELTSSARPYQYGDPWKRIHWKASARRQALMVRETENEEKDSLLIWLDLARKSYAKDKESLETAISLTATLLTHFQTLGKPVSFMATGREIREFSLPVADFDDVRHFLALAMAYGDREPGQALATLPDSGNIVALTAWPSPDLVKQINARSRRSQRIMLLLAGAQEYAVPHLDPAVEVRCYKSA